MLTRNSTISPSRNRNNNVPLIASFILILFCLIKMERYISVSSGAYVEQRISTEQVEPFQPVYNIPVLGGRSVARAAAGAAPIANESQLFRRLFSLLKHNYSISVQLIRHACAEPAPDFFGYLHLRHCCISPDGAGSSPVII